MSSDLDKIVTLKKRSSNFFHGSNDDDDESNSLFDDPWLHKVRRFLAVTNGSLYYRRYLFTPSTPRSPLKYVGLS